MKQTLVILSATADEPWTTCPRPPFRTSLWLPQPVLKRWLIQIALTGTRNWETERLNKLAMELKGEGCSDVKLILKITLKLML